MLTDEKQMVENDRESANGDGEASNVDKTGLDEGMAVENDDVMSDGDMPPQPIKDDAILVLIDHTNETLAVAASPTDPTLLITGGMDDVGMIWDLEQNACVAKVDGGNDSVSTVAFSHDGKYAAFGSENGSISIVFMDGSASPTPSALEGPADTINFLSWHPRGPVLLAGSADRTSYMWNAPKGTFLMAFVGHEDAVTCGSFTADGKLVVTASKDSSVRVWSPSTGETLIRIQTGLSGMRSAFHTADIHCLAVGNENSISEKLFVTGCAAGDVFISHRENAQIIAQLPRHEGGVESVAFSSKSLAHVYIAIGGADGIVRVWDLESSTERCHFSHSGVIAKVVWHPQKSILLSASSDGSLVLWDILKGEEMVRLTGHRAFVTDVCFNGDSGFIASTSADGSVRLFDVRDIVASVV